MLYSRDWEIDMISYCLSKPLYLRQHKERLVKLKFQDKFINLTYQAVFKCLNAYGTVPTETELKKMLAESMAEHEKFNLLEIEAVQDIVTDICSRNVTSITGMSISNYLIEEEARALSEELGTHKAETLVSHLKDYEQRINKLSYFFTEDEDLGLNLFSDAGILKAKALLEAYNTEDCISSGYPIWDRQLSGGFRRGELCIIMSSTNVGKTSCLLNLAANFINQGLRVVYLALDNLSGEMVQRTIGCFMNRDISEKIDPGAALDDLSDKYKEAQKNNLFIKHFAPRELNKSKLERYLARLKTYLYEIDRANGLPLDLCGDIPIVIIDYLDVMLAESTAGEFWISAEHLSQEIKAVLKNNNILGITATQGGTVALQSDTLKLWMAAGAKSRFNAPDLVFAMSQNDDERMAKPASKFRLGCLKARRAKVNYEIAFQFWKEKQVIREDPAFNDVLHHVGRSGNQATDASGNTLESRNDYANSFKPAISTTITNLEKIEGIEKEEKGLFPNVACNSEGYPIDSI